MWKEIFCPQMIQECLEQGVDNLVVNVPTEELANAFFEILPCFGINISSGVRFTYGSIQCYRIQFRSLDVHYGYKPTYEGTDRFGSLRLCTYTGFFPDDSDQEMESASDEDLRKLFV